MRRHTRFGLVFALSLSLTAPLLAKELLSKETLAAKRQEGAKPSGGNTAGRRRDSDRDAETKVCRLPVRFTQVQNEGLRAQPEKYDNPEFREAYYLLSINGIPLADKSAQEIKKFCRGKLGESAVLGILNRDLEYKEFTLPYEMLRRDQRMQVKKSNVRSMLYSFDGTNGPREVGSRGDEFEMFDLPVFSSAWAEQHVLDAQDSPATSRAVVDNAAAESAQILLQVGNIDPAKQMIKLLQQSPLVDSKYRRRETDKYAKLMPLVDLWGMNREAVSIGTKRIAETKPAEIMPVETNNAKTQTAKSQAAISTTETERFYDTNNNRLQTYIALSKVIKNSGEAAIFESTAPALAEQALNRNSYSFWLADYFEKVGKFDQAIALYVKVLAQYEKPPFVNAAINKDVSTARLHAYVLVRLAQLAHKSGHSADDYLKRAAEVYRSNFNKEQLALIERIPDFSPSLNQIEAAISDNKKLDNPKDKKDDNKLLASLGPVATRTDASDKEIEFATVTLSAYAALEKADYVAVQRYTNQLIEIYKQEEIRAEFPRPSINIFCSLISFAEKLSDKGRFEQANKLLDQLKTADKDFDSNVASAFFIDLEKTLNTSRSKNSEESWKALFSSWNSGYQEYEGLRALAALYTTAGDTIRASILLDRAITLCNAGSDKNQSRDIALLYLDKAWLEASQSHFAEAQNYLKQSIEAIDASKVSGLSRDLNHFNRQYMGTAVKLAQCYRHKGKPVLAEEALKTIISRVDSGKSWLGVFDQSQGSAPDRSVPNLYYYYGRLLADRGDLAGARPYLDKAITASKNNVPGVMRFVRAKVAEAQKDYDLAALYYSEVSQESYDHDVQALIMMQPDLKETYCRLALEFALKAKKLKAEELAKIYTRLADALRQDSRKEQLELYNKAFPLMADGQEKQQLAIKIANLSSQQNTTSTGTGDKVDHSAEFKMREAAALLAQKTNPNNAAQLWVSLANSEISAKLYDSAINHLKTAIAAVQKQPAIFETNYAQFFCYPMVPLSGLTEGGRKADAEAIGKLLLDKADTLYGNQSAEYRQALTAMFSFYAGQKDFKAANQYLGQILAIDPRKFELGRSPSGHFSTPEDMAFALTLKEDTRAYGMEALNKILINRLNTYGPDDMHTMDILSKIGQAETKAGNFADAEKHLRMAMGIANFYDATSQFYFRSSPVSAMQDLLSAQKRTDELKQLQDKIQINRKEAEKMGSIADRADIDATQKFYDFWHKKSPYSSRSLSSGIKLLESAVTKKDWPSVKTQAPECIKMLAHNSPFLVGGCTPSPSPATQKFYCFKNLIQACIETGERQQALSWLKQAKSEKSYQPMTEELIFLSEIENICGNKKEALELCHQAEKTLPSDQNWNYYRHPVNELYKKIGSEPDTQRIQLEGQATQLIRIEEEIRKSERERKQKAAEEASRKKLPAEAVAMGLDSSKNNKGENNKVENVWHPEPHEPQVLEPAKEIKDTYKFEYAALASTNLSLGNGAFVKQRQAQGPLPFPNYSFAGCFGEMSSPQPKHKAGDLMFLYDGAKGSLRPKVEVTQAPVDLQQLMQAHPGGTGATGVGGVGGVGGPGFGGYGGRGTGGGGGAFLGGIMGPQFTEPPAVMARPFRPALTAPANSTALDGKSLILKAGDYIADNLTVERIVMPQPGRVRIFIKDNSVKKISKLTEQKKAAMPGSSDDKATAVFASNEGAFINKGAPWAFFQQRSTLEIWYNGTDTISLGDETKFTGIIYAPNATIRLGKGVEFLGAMVAKNIFAGEDTTITYLYDLHNWKQD